LGIGLFIPTSSDLWCARFHGVFAPNFKHRARIVPRRLRNQVDADKPLAPMSWVYRQIYRPHSISPDTVGLKLRDLSGIKHTGQIQTTRVLFFHP
jgi:hypothetical protein